MTIWIDRNINPKRVAAWAGHTSVSFTLDRYGHLYHDSEQAELNGLDAVIREIQET